MKLEFSGEMFDTFAAVLNSLGADQRPIGYTCQLRFVSEAPPLDVELYGIDRTDAGDLLRVRSWDDEADGPRGDIYTVNLDDVDTIYVY